MPSFPIPIHLQNTFSCDKLQFIWHLIFDGHNFVFRMLKICLRLIFQIRGQNQVLHILRFGSI